MIFCLSSWCKLRQNYGGQFSTGLQMCQNPDSLVAIRVCAVGRRATGWMN